MNIFHAKLEGSQLNSILVTLNQECLVTRECVCSHSLVSISKPMKGVHMKKLKKEPTILDNLNFKRFIYTTMIVSTLIANLGYISPRESS